MGAIMCKKIVLTGVLFGALLLTGCMAGPNPTIHTAAVDGSPAGFWLGLWQGIIAPAGLIISLFDGSVNIYEVHNNGSWYNVGYLVGAHFLSAVVTPIAVWSIVILIREITIWSIVITADVWGRVRRLWLRKSTKIFPPK